MATTVYKVIPIDSESFCAGYTQKNERPPRRLKRKHHTSIHAQQDHQSCTWLGSCNCVCLCYLKVHVMLHGLCNIINNFISKGKIKLKEASASNLAHVDGFLTVFFLSCPESFILYISFSHIKHWMLVVIQMTELKTTPHAYASL